MMEMTKMYGYRTFSIVFRVDEIREAFLRKADPALVNVLSWLVRQDSAEGRPPFMHHFPDKPNTLNLVDLHNFINDWCFAVLFNKTRDSLKNDIRKKMEVFEEFKRVAEVLYNQDFTENSLWKSEVYFLQLFLTLFRQTVNDHLEQKPTAPPSIENFGTPQSTCTSGIQPDTNMFCTTFADGDKLMFSFDVETTRDYEEAVNLAIKAVGVPLGGQFGIFCCHPGVFPMYFGWVCPRKLDRYPTTMLKEQYLEDYVEIQHPFEMARLGIGAEDREVQFDVQDRTQESMFPYRKLFEDYQFGRPVHEWPVVPRMVDDEEEMDED
ncbi:hypothetical protein L596_004753 [Steinernema carpocapsae]|uniref:Uncharacterized protein n=1 Tax=Steinernema carpocapsae TaxID=34508 RepID=A0A4U8V0Y4_STECR|nr:hypothetical protein L596_004753 [Steinernema carpocapsae]